MRTRRCTPGFSAPDAADDAGGVLRGFEIDAQNLEEAIGKFAAAVQEALKQAIEEAQEYRREAQSRIVVPEVGGGGLPGGIPGGGRIKL